MESLSFLFRFLGCALMGVVFFALMHRGGSAAPPAPDGGEVEELRAEVVQLRAELTEFRGAKASTEGLEAR